MTARAAQAPRRRLTELLSSEFMARLDGLDVVSRKILQGKMAGERRAKRRGQSVEFADHRPYVVGDDLRFVDWNVYARLEQLFLKLFLEELDLSVLILADVSGSVAWGDPPKDLAVKKLTAALAYVALVNNNRVTVGAFADGLVGQLTNLRGRRNVRRLADLLLTTEAGGPSDFERACRQFVSAAGGTGVIVVISDFLLKEGYETGLRHLLARRGELYVVQVLCPQETAPELSGDLRLIDLEDADAAEVTVSGALIDYYKRNLAAYCNELRDFCHRRGAAYLRTGSDEPVESFVLTTLRRYGMLR